MLGFRSMCHNPAAMSPEQPQANLNGVDAWFALKGAVCGFLRTFEAVQLRYERRERIRLGHFLIGVSSCIVSIDTFFLQKRSIGRGGFLKMINWELLHLRREKRYAKLLYSNLNFQFLKHFSFFQSSEFMKWTDGWSTRVQLFAFRCWDRPCWRRNSANEDSTPHAFCNQERNDFCDFRIQK